MSSHAKCSRCGIYSVHPAGPNWCLACRAPNFIAMSNDGRFVLCWHNGSNVRSVFMRGWNFLDVLAPCQEYYVETLGVPAVLEAKLRTLTAGDKVLVEGVVEAVTSKGVVVRCKDVDFEGATVHAPAWAVNRKECTRAAVHQSASE